MKIPHWVRLKRFWIPTIVVLVLAIVVIVNVSNNKPEPQIQGDSTKAVDVIAIEPKELITSDVILKGTILPQEYTRVKSLVNANLQFLIPVGTEVRKGDQIAVLSDGRIEDSYFASLSSLQDSNQNLTENQALNIESLNQAQLGVSSAQSSLALAEDNFDSTLLLTEQNLISSQDNARISYQSAYNLVEEVIRYWGGGTLSEFILEDTPTANKELLLSMPSDYDEFKQAFLETSATPSEADLAQSIANIEPLVDEAKRFNDSVLRLLNYSIADPSRGFTQGLIDGYKLQATTFVGRINSTNSTLRGSKNALLNVDIANTTQLLAAENQLKQAQIQLENAQASQESTKRQIEIRELGARSQVSGTQTQFASAQSQYDNLFLRAPFDGVIIAHRANVGDQVIPGMDLVEMGQIEAVEIQLAIDDRDSQFVSIGQEVVIDDNPELVGIISEIAPTASLITGKVDVTVIADNQQGDFIPGDVAEVAITRNVTLSQEIVLPLSTVTVAQDNTFVLLVRDGKVAEQAVTLGEVFGSQVVVTSGLSEGELVILKNGDFLEIGDVVEVNTLETN